MTFNNAPTNTAYMHFNCNIHATILLQLHLHTGDVSEVYQHIPPECLPKDFGGELEDVETLHGREHFYYGFYFYERKIYYKSDILKVPTPFLLFV